MLVPVAAMPLVLVVTMPLVMANALVVTRPLVGPAGVCGLSLLLARGGVRAGEQHRHDQTSNEPESSHEVSTSRGERVASAPAYP
jgi:hypothetical protein